MKIVDFLGRLFGKNTSGQIVVDNWRSDIQTGVALEAFALFTTIEMIAGLMSKCEFRTYKQGKEIRQHEWVNLNYRPNKNQNSTQFWQEVICKLLYRRECLVIPWGEEKIIADSFSKDEYVLTETVFSDVSRGNFTFQRPFGMSDVYYFRYSNNDVQSIIDSIFAMYQQLISSASHKYIRNGKEKGILNITAKAQGDVKFEEKFKQLMENYFKSYFDSSMNSVLPLFEGYSYDVKNGNSKGENDVSDISRLVDGALARAAQAFKIPSALVCGDVAGLKDSYDIMLTNCIDPLADLISEELTSKQFSPIEIIHGNYIEADTSTIKHIDIFGIADKIDKLIACGFFSIDETREKAGCHEIGENWSKQHYMTKNYTTADMTMKGGEE